MYLMVGIPRHVRVLRKTESLEILFGYMCCIDVNVLCALPAMCLFVWEEVFIPLSMRLTPRNRFFFQVVSNLITGIFGLGLAGWHSRSSSSTRRLCICACTVYLDLELKAQCYFMMYKYVDFDVKAFLYYVLKRWLWYVITILQSFRFWHDSMCIK